jgi:hypothetical protein
MNDYKKEAAKILRIIFTNANGDSASTIRKYQGTSLPGFGIMLPRLKEIASEYASSNDLCFELIEKNTREARIIAILVSEPLELTSSQIKRIEGNACTEELRNYMARFILAPIITENGLQKLNNVVSTPLLLKATVQAYRMYNTMPPYSTCCQLLEQHIRKNCRPMADAQHLAEATYFFYKGNSSQFEEWLETIPERNTPLAHTIDQWITDFSYQDF